MHDIETLQYIHFKIPTIETKLFRNTHLNIYIYTGLSQKQISLSPVLFCFVFAFFFFITFFYIFVLSFSQKMAAQFYIVYIWRKDDRLGKAFWRLTCLQTTTQFQRVVSCDIHTHKPIQQSHPQIFAALSCSKSPSFVARAVQKKKNRKQTVYTGLRKGCAGDARHLHMMKQTNGIGGKW